jgi:hypothetical protein
VSSEVSEQERLQRLAERVAKLLALAGDQAGTPEGDLAAATARRVMEQYGLTDGQVANGGDPLIRVDVLLGGGEAWRRDLVNTVAHHCTCFPLSVVGLLPRRMEVFGRRSSCQVTEYLFSYLSAEVMRRCDAHINAKKAELAALWEGAHPEARAAYVKKHGRAANAWTPGEIRSAKVMFCNGAVEALRSRLIKASEGEERADAQGFALVLARADEARDFARKTVGDWDEVKPDSRRKMGRNGYAAGMTMPINDAMDGQPVSSAPGLLAHDKGGV